MSKPFYFAHPISDYSTEFEQRVVTWLTRTFVDMGAPVALENPNQPRHQEGYLRRKMDYFLEEVLPNCAGCVFLAFPGGILGSGVAMEAMWFLKRGLPVFEVYEPRARDFDLREVKGLESYTTLSRDETRGASMVLKTLWNGGRS